jgi:Predicted hydrolases or acyltransferases (alpha/beta hydrolase superfamily)
MSFIEVNGCRFRYSEKGDPNNPTIITLHGGRGISDHKGDFEAFSPLTDEYRLFSFDQRGCGESDLKGPYTFEQYADDLEAIREKLLGDGKFILSAGSFGGMIGLTYACKYPHRLSHLVLRGTAASNKQEKDVYEIFAQRMHRAPNATMEMVEKLISDKAIDDEELRLIFFALQPLYYDEWTPELANRALERARTLNVHAHTHNELFRLNNKYDLVDQLHKITCPTLVVVGEKDWQCPPAYAKEMADGVQNGELVIFENCDHSCHVEDNPRMIRIMREFLKR